MTDDTSDPRMPWIRQRSRVWTSPENPVDTDDVAREPEAYTVGYKRPPLQHRFKPGQSGNAKGRPRSALNAATILDKELKALVTVTSNGKKQQLSKRDVMIRQLSNKAAEGNLKALEYLQKYFGDAFMGKPPAGPSDPAHPAEKSIFSNEDELFSVLNQIMGGAQKQGEGETK
jgi:hypothetical protein